MSGYLYSKADLTTALECNFSIRRYRRFVIYSHGNMDHRLPRDYDGAQATVQAQEELQEDAVRMLLRRHHRRSGTVRSRLPDAADVQRDAIRLLSRWRVACHWFQEQGLPRFSLQRIALRLLSGRCHYGDRQRLRGMQEALQRDRVSFYIIFYQTNSSNHLSLSLLVRIICILFFSHITYNIRIT